MHPLKNVVNDINSSLTAGSKCRLQVSGAQVPGVTSQVRRVSGVIAKYAGFQVSSTRDHVPGFRDLVQRQNVKNLFSLCSSVNRL